MERNYLALIPLLAASSALNIAAATAPQIYNNYSFVPPGAPNHVVAQGSIFAIKNSLGPPKYSPLQATPVAGYGGVTINVTVNGTTVQALNYYVGPQLAGVLPSNTPTGLGNYTVTYNGLTTAPAPIMVVQNSFGILTMDSSGQGQAKVCDYNFDSKCLTYVSFEQSAKPGDVITIWGSGLGPTQNDAVSVDMTKTVPVEVWIGGQQATVTYAARSQFVGLDLINTSIPANVSGCFVSVVVKIGNNVSNSTYLPVEQNGDACSDPLTGLSGPILSALLSTKSFNAGIIAAFHRTLAGGPIDRVNASFYHIQTSGLASLQQFIPFASPGSCTVWTLSVDQNGNPIGLPITPLDAGTVTVTSNGSTMTLAKQSSGTYRVNLASGFLTGTVSVTNGNGGADVMGFTANTTAHSGFTWTNSAAVSTINRSHGQEIDWSGEAANSFVTITGLSETVDPVTLVPALTAFTCLEDASKEKFTIPPSVLLAIPQTSTQTPGSGTLEVGNSTAPGPFTAMGLDFGLIEFVTSTRNNVTYQ
jgi:uncharacterized protein (TIGR03437 family)